MRGLALALALAACDPHTVCLGDCDIGDTGEDITVAGLGSYRGTLTAEVHTNWGPQPCSGQTSLQVEEGGVVSGEATCAGEGTFLNGPVEGEVNAQGDLVAIWDPESWGVPPLELVGLAVESTLQATFEHHGQWWSITEGELVAHREP